LCVPDADKVLIDVGREQTEQGRVLATQDDHASMFRALDSICFKARELHSSVRRLLVVAREQHNEVARVLNGLVHFFDKVRSNRDVVVVDEAPVALLSETVGALRRNSGHGAATAQEEVVSLTGTAWHGATLVLSNGHAEQCGPSRMRVGSEGERSRLPASVSPTVSKSLLEDHERPTVPGRSDFDKAWSKLRFRARSVLIAASIPITLVARGRE